MSARTSYAQFSIMVDFMEKHGDLSKPQHLPNGRQWCLLKWKELAELLNSEGIGECRSEEKWRKVWSDLKNNTKRKWAKMNRSVHGTGGGPALKMNLTEMENRVMAIIGVQAAVGMPIPEIGFITVEEYEVQTKPDKDIVEEVATMKPIGDEDWNMPGCSHGITPVSPTQPANSPPRAVTPPRATPPQCTTPPKSPEIPPRPSTALPPPTPPPQQERRRKKRSIDNIEEYLIGYEMRNREDNREREMNFIELERERLRLREIELQQRDRHFLLQAQWLELVREGFKMLDKYLNEKK